MLRSFRRTLPLILVIMTAGTVDLQDWGVNYSSSYVCALKGSTVKISCTLKYPEGHNIEKAFWTKPPITNRDLPNLCLNLEKNDPEKAGRVQCVRDKDKDTYSITVTGVTEADQHIYYCRFSTDVQGAKWTGVPGVQLDVTGLQVETRQSVKEGDSVTLTCKSSCSLTEETTFIWYRGEERLTDQTMNKLHLRSVSLSDIGNYRCAAGGNKRLISPPVYLKVGVVDGQQNWGVDYSSSYVCALKGSTVKISCALKYPQGYNVQTVFWTKPTIKGETPDVCSEPEKTGRVQCDRDKDKDTYSITVTDVTEADQHIYYCKFITNTETGKWTGVPGVQLDITGLQVETHQSVKEGDSVTLTCKSSCSLTEETTFIWFRNTQRLTDRTVKQIHLPSVSLSDAGNYRCAAGGNERLISPPVYLNVEYPPRSVSVSISGSSEVLEGDSVRLICSSDSNPPALTFSWFQENHTSAVGSGQSFSISSFNSSLSGRFYCEARNKYGSERSHAVSLSVKESSSSSSWVRLSVGVSVSAVVTSVMLMVFVYLFRHNNKVESENTYMTLDPTSRRSEYDTLDNLKRSCENTDDPEDQDPVYNNM